MLTVQCYCPPFAQSISEIKELFKINEIILTNDFSGMVEIVSLAEKVGEYINIQDLTKYDTVFKLVKSYGFSGDLEILLGDIFEDSYNFQGFEASHVTQIKRESKFSLVTRRVIDWSKEVVEKNYFTNAILEIVEQISQRKEINQIMRNILMLPLRSDVNSDEILAQEKTRRFVSSIEVAIRSSSKKTTYGDQSLIQSLFNEGHLSTSVSC